MLLCFSGKEGSWSWWYWGRPTEIILVLTLTSSLAPLGPLTHRAKRTYYWPCMVSVGSVGTLSSLHWCLKHIWKFWWNSVTAQWHFRELCMGGDGWDGWTDDSVSNPTGERKFLSEHNRKRTEQKQVHVFLHIKPLPVALGLLSHLHSASTFTHSFTSFFFFFGRPRNWSCFSKCIKVWMQYSVK